MNCLAFSRMNFNVGHGSICHKKGYCELLFFSFCIWIGSTKVKVLTRNIECVIRLSTINITIHICGGIVELVKMRRQLCVKTSSLTCFFKRIRMPPAWNTVFFFLSIECYFSNDTHCWAGKHTRTQRSISNWFISNIYRLIVPDTPRTTRRATEFKNTNCQCITIASVLWPALVVGTMIGCVTTKCGTTVSLRLWMCLSG